MTSISEHEAQRIRSLRSYNLLDTEPELEFDELTQLAAFVCEAPIATVSLADECRQWFKSSVGTDLQELPREISFCSHAIQDAKDLMEVPDARADVRFSNNPLVVEEPHIRFYAGAPLISTDGYALGTLCVLDFVPRTLTPAQTRALKTLAKQVMVLIELRRTRNGETDNDLDQRAEARFREAEEMYRTLIEQVPAVAYIADYGIGGKWHYISPRIESVLGYRPQEWIQNPYLWYERIHPEDRDRAVAEEEKGWVSAYDRPFKSQYRMVARDGTVVWVSDECVVVRDENGTPLYYRGVLIDISDLKEAELAHQKLAEQLRQTQKMDAIGRLAGGVAHDFNNLLSVIINYSHFVLEGLDQNDSRRSDVAEILKAGERASTLVHQLLTFSRKEIVSPQVVNLNEIVTDIDTLLRTTTGEQISLEINLAPELFPTKADRGQLEQVVANLAVNARDAMPDGGTLTIRTRNLSNSGAELPRDFATGTYVCLEVGDTGTGMTEETLAHAFEPFFTTKARGEGTGLGLATVYGIVQQTGGYVTAHSSPPNGSTFYVYLPATAEKEGPPPEAHSELVSATGGGQTILVAEDEDGVRAVVQRVLTTHGYRVIVATSGEEAIALARAHDGPIDVLLTDVVMPKMSGTELADALAEERDGVTVIFMSGYTEEIASRTGGLGDPDNFLPKPFTREQLLAKLHALLEHTVG
jgi:two-component system cell cycle sensor histidine kinase/response regulator CckA